VDLLAEQSLVALMRFFSPIKELPISAEHAETIREILRGIFEDDVLDFTAICRGCGRVSKPILHSDQWVECLRRAQSAKIQRGECIQLPKSMCPECRAEENARRRQKRAADRFEA
jgi:hypothetical protein